MGAGTSNIDHLSGLQKKELTRQMKAEYLRCLKLVMTPDEQQTLLLKKYDEALADVQANPFKNLVSAKKSKTKDESSVRESRRRSFDKNADNTEENATAVNTDTWDSVSFQPSCVLCGMVFASTEKLNHHIKQSALHATNLRKAATPAKVSSSGGDEGNNQYSYKMLYTGSKLFYQTQDTFEINIYLHQKKTNCIELIAYDTSTGIELPRIYLNEMALLERIGKKTLKARVSAEQENMSVRTLKKFKGVVPSEAQLMEEEKRILLSSFIMTRLQLSSSSGSFASKRTGEGVDIGALIMSLSGVLEKKLLYIPRDTDNGKIETCTFDGPPQGVIPVNVIRRRHSTDAEMRESMDGLNGMQMYVHMKTGRSVIARSDSFCRATQKTAVMTAPPAGIIEMSSTVSNSSLPPESDSSNCTDGVTSSDAKTPLATSLEQLTSVSTLNMAVNDVDVSASSADYASSAWK